MSPHSPRTVRAQRFRRAGVCVVLAMTAALAAVAPAQATSRAPSHVRCIVMVSGAHWSIRGSGSGTTYKVVAEGLSCSVAKTWVQKLTHRTSGAIGSTFKAGPAGFTCRSLSTAASGDKLLYAGACVHSPGVPFFGWSAKP
jgi:hypothetical protein